MNGAEMGDPNRERLAILDAMVTVIDRRAEFLTVVADSESADEAHTRLQSEWGFDEIQAQAVLDLQIRRFAGRERARIDEERKQLAKLVVGPDV